MTPPLIIQTLEAHLQRLVQAQGSPSPLSITEVAGIKSIAAHIEHADQRAIKIQIPSDWNPVQYAAIAHFARKLQLDDPRTKIAQDIAFHEVGHRKLKHDVSGLGCPEDLHGKEIAVEAVSKAMLEAGRFSQPGALYLENCIADIVNLVNCSHYTKLNGHSIYFAEQAEVNGRKYSPVFEAFVKLNMALSGTPRQRRMLQQYYTNEKRIDDAVAACFRDLSLTENKSANRDILFTKAQWPTIFYTFGKHLAPLLDHDAREVLPHIGAQGYKVPAQFEKEIRFSPEDIDDPFLRQVLDPDNLKKVLQRRNRNNEGLPSFVENWRALDYFYQGLASEIMIKADTPKKGERLPIAPIQARAFDPDTDQLEHILFGRILFDAQGDVCFAVPRHYVEHTAKYKQSIMGYPELNIAVLDNSVSMEFPANSNGAGNTTIVPWGDNSRYHYAVLAYYGVEKALHRLGVGTRTRYNLITFSSRTMATGERTYEDKAEIKKRILQPLFGASTTIDVDVLAKSAREPGSMYMTISDGEIQNWNEWYTEPVMKDGKEVQKGVTVKERFKHIIADKFYVHFQIGGKTAMSQDLESWGCAVVTLGDASQLPTRAIDITKRFYQNYATGEQQ